MVELPLSLLGLNKPLAARNDLVSGNGIINTLSVCHD